MRVINSVVFKRIHIGNPGDLAGHWWFEIGDSEDVSSESYGWWPTVSGLRLWQVVRGVAGELNDGLNGLVPPRDPHHGEERVDERFHPLVEDDDRRTDEQIADCLREFATTYSGKWWWLLGWGSNCHTFQKRALMHCGLLEPDGVRKAKL